MGVRWQRSSLATVLARLHPMPNKDRATNPPPEKPGGESWLVSPEQQLDLVLMRRNALLVVEAN